MVYIMDKFRKEWDEFETKFWKRYSDLWKITNMFTMVGVNKTAVRKNHNQNRKGGNKQNGSQTYC